MLKTGCQWRMLPKDFPSCDTVFYYCNKWKQEGVFEELMGRKEHIVVDTLGLPMSVVVHEANVHDSVGADGVIDKMKGCFPRLKKMLADGGYKGQKLSDTVRQKLGAELTVVLRPDESSKKFSVLPLRWIVERSFSCWKTFEESPWITSSILIRERQWFNLPSADSCITNYATKFKYLLKPGIVLEVQRCV